MMEFQKRPLKVIVLAAGSATIRPNGLPVLLEDLGESKVIDAVLANLKAIVSDDEITIVTGKHHEAIEEHLGNSYHYVTQENPQGTGHAVGVLEPSLGNFTGDLLIVYGDTPLFSLTSLRGLLNRHHQCNTKLSLLTAIADRSYPYGRVIRNHTGKIIGLKEEAQASEEEKQIRELNLGAYVVSSDEFWNILASVAPKESDEEYRLTDIVQAYIQHNLSVETFQVYDQDEIQGINSKEDLEHATFIVQKRYFRQKSMGESSTIKFGTGGWRAVIGEGFTLPNVRRLSQALANEIIRQKLEDQGVMIGFDHRFLSNRAAEVAAEVFSGNNVKVHLLTEGAPTPLIEFAAEAADVAYGLAFTASHNAPEYNGLKVFHGNGGLLMTEETNQIETEANQLTMQKIVQIPLSMAQESGVVQLCDYTNEYLERVESFVDMELIRAAGLRLIVDPMFGVGRFTLGIILSDARCRVTFINERHNPLFGGRSPAPNLNALRMLMAYVRDGSYDLGLATDGDADRIALIDERGEFIQINDILLLLYWYLHEFKGLKGGVVRNLATTHQLDKLAEQFGETCIETPVGFKWIANGIEKSDALLGGESSGGLTIRGHIRGKDGILASILLIEMVAKTGKSISSLLEEVWQLTGRAHMVESNCPATVAMRVVVPQRIGALIESKAIPWEVEKIRTDDGTKLFFTDGSWLLLRFSGTEPVLRIFAEASTSKQANQLVDWLKSEVTV